MWEHATTFSALFVRNTQRPANIFLRTASAAILVLDQVTFSVKWLPVRCLFQFSSPDRASRLSRRFATIKVRPSPPVCLVASDSWSRTFASGLANAVQLYSAHWRCPTDWGWILSHQQCCRHTAAELDLEIAAPVVDSDLVEEGGLERRPLRIWAVQI
jgi:hypothetical protein